MFFFHRATFSLFTVFLLFLIYLQFVPGNVRNLSDISCYTKNEEIWEIKIERFKKANKRIKFLYELVKFNLCSYYVTYVFQSESTLCSHLNVKKLSAQNRCDI